MRYSTLFKFIIWRLNTQVKNKLYTILHLKGKWVEILTKVITHLPVREAIDLQKVVIEFS